MKKTTKTSGDKITNIVIHHNSGQPQTTTLPTPATPAPATVAPPKPFVNAGQSARTEAWHERRRERQASFACHRILRKSGNTLSMFDVLKLGRTNLPALVDLAKSCSAWPKTPDTDKNLIEAGLLPKVEHKVETLADLKATLRPDELRRLSAADRLEILTGVFIGGPKKLPQAEHLRKTQTSAPGSNPGRTPSTISPGDFRRLKPQRRGEFIRDGGVIAAPLLARADFEKLNPSDRMQFVKSGGQLTD